jgi:SAM-dependent methyltransferase
MSSAAGRPAGHGVTDSKPAEQGLAERGPRHDAQRAVARARHAATTARQAAASQARRSQGERPLFAQPVQDYLYQVLGRPLSVLRAGLATPAGELGLARLRDSGYEITVTTVDQDTVLARETLARETLARETLARQTLARQTLAREVRAEEALAAETLAGTGLDQRAPAGPVILGDLRAVPLPPRSFDVVYCAFLLERIPNAALVLDRFVATLRPGGLLLLRIRDRNCAAAVLDRSAPEPLRRALWDRLHPGEPGPFPAVYDPLTSARGIESYATAHGLVITRRESARTRPDRPVRLAAALRVTRILIGWLSRNRRTDAHDELLYVIRKPEDSSARLV